MRVIGLRGLALAGLVGGQRAELAQGGHIVVDRPLFGCLAVAEAQDVDHGYGDEQAWPSRSQEAFTLDSTAGQPSEIACRTRLPGESHRG